MPKEFIEREEAIQFVIEHMSRTIKGYEKKSRDQADLRNSYKARC